MIRSWLDLFIFIFSSYCIISFFIIFIPFRTNSIIRYYVLAFFTSALSCLLYYKYNGFTLLHNILSISGILIALNKFGPDNKEDALLLKDFKRPKFKFNANKEKNKQLMYEVAILKEKLSNMEDQLLAHYNVKGINPANETSTPKIELTNYKTEVDNKTSPFLTPYIIPNKKPDK